MSDFTKTGESKVKVVATEPSVDVLTSEGYKIFLPKFIFTALEPKFY